MYHFRIDANLLALKCSGITLANVDNDSTATANTINESHTPGLMWTVGTEQLMMERKTNQGRLRLKTHSSKVVLSYSLSHCLCPWKTNSMSMVLSEALKMNRQAWRLVVITRCPWLTLRPEQRGIALRRTLPVP